MKTILIAVAKHGNGFVVRREFRDTDGLLLKVNSTSYTASDTVAMDRALDLSKDSGFATVELRDTL